VWHCHRHPAPTYKTGRSNTKRNNKGYSWFIDKLQNHYTQVITLNERKDLPSIFIGVIQVYEGLIQLLVTCEDITTKLHLENFNLVGVLSDSPTIIGQTIVDCPIGRNQVFRNAEFGS
jgi:hypothetical protein